MVLFVVAICGGAFWYTHTKTFTIHYVNYRGRTNVDVGFEQGLKDRGVRYRIVYHDVQRKPERIPMIIQEIKDDKETDLVVSWGTTVTLGVFGKYTEDSERYLNGKPGIFTLVTDPIRSKIIDPGSTNRHITGAWHVAPLESQFGAMMAYKPKKVGILFSPTEDNAVVTADLLKKVASIYKIEVIAVPFDVGPDGKVVSTNTEAALDTIKAAGADWLYLGPDSFLGTQAEKLVIPAAHKRGLLTFASTEQLMEAGAAFGLISTYKDLGLIAAKQAASILVEELPPSKLPVTSVNRFQHQLNSKVLKTLDFKDPLFLTKDVVDVAK